MTFQSVPRKDASKQSATAKRLNAVRGVAQHILDATVAFSFEERRPIIVKPGEYYDLFFVRSLVGTSLYFPVHADPKTHTWVCSCGDKGCRHIEAAMRYQQHSQRQEVA